MAFWLICSWYKTHEYHCNFCFVIFWNISFYGVIFPDINRKMARKSKFPANGSDSDDFQDAPITTQGTTQIRTTNFPAGHCFGKVKFPLKFKICIFFVSE